VHIHNYTLGTDIINDLRSNWIETTTQEPFQQHSISNYISQNSILLKYHEYQKKKKRCLRGIKMIRSSAGSQSKQAKRLKHRKKTKKR